MGPKAVPQIEVTFDIDANGILNVSAKDKGTGKEQNITIQSSGGLSNAEIEQMQKDAEKFAEADKQKRELIEERNKMDNIIYDCEKQVDELMEECRVALKDDAATPESLREKWQELQNYQMKTFQDAYQKKAAENSSPSDSSSEQTEQESSDKKEEEKK